MTTTVMGKHVSAEIRRGFVCKVYGILSVQLAVTALVAGLLAVAAPAWLISNAWLMLPCVAIHAGMALLVSVYEKALRIYPLNYVLLFAWTLAQSVMVGFVSAQHTWESVLLAAGITGVVFLCLTAYAFHSKSDFTGFGPYFVAVVMVLLVFGMGISVMSLCGVAVTPLILIFDVIGVLLFMCYIVFDTQLIIGEFGGHKHQLDTDDFCLAALLLYLDIIELFLFVLDVLDIGDKNKKKK